MIDTSTDAVKHTVAHMRLCYGKDYPYAALIEALAAARDAANARAEMLADSVAKARDIWTDPSRYTDTCDIVQVLCEVTEPNISQFPRSCELPISSGDHAVADRFVSVGWRDDEGEWFVAGWDMTQDCWTDARCFVVHGFRPMADATLPAAQSHAYAAHWANTALGDMIGD